MSARPGSLDLLQQRRRVSGSPGQKGPLLPARRLLLQGSALGGCALLLMLLLFAVISWRQQQLSSAAVRLAGVKTQFEALESRINQVRRAKTQLKRSSEGLAKGLVAATSGSALVTQLSAVTPSGIQLTEVRSSGKTLVLKGVSVDPEAFRRVNGLVVLLSQAPLFDPESVQVVKLQRDNSSQGPVEWELSARFAELSPDQELAVLQSLQANGLVRRLGLLRVDGVL